MPPHHPVTLDALKAAHPLRSVLSGAGCVEDTPGYFKCPIHPAQGTGSFHLRDNETRWYCFSCGEGGDALDLIAKLRGVSLADAIKQLRSEAPPSLSAAGAHGGGNRTVVFDNASPAAGPTATAKDERPPIAISPLWARCVGFADAAAWSHPGLATLAKRMGSKGAALAVARRWAAVMPGADADRWIRSRASEGYLLALPLYSVPEVEMGGALPSAETPAAPDDLALRWCGVGRPPEQKVLRIPRACRGRTVFFGFLPAAVLEAEAGDLYVGEGWADSLSLRIAADGRLSTGTLGLASCASAKRSGSLLRAEIEAARLLGRRGPKRVRLCAQNDEPSREGMKRLAGELRGLADLQIGIAEAPRA
jgi:hypothetical protein